eukprot:4364707-Amphidinium_carterae.2
MTEPSTHCANPNNANYESDGEDQGDMNDEDVNDEENDEEEFTSPNFELLERALILHEQERKQEEKQDVAPQPLPVETTETRGRSSKDDVPNRFASRAFVGSADAFVMWGQCRIAYYENKKIFQATCHKHAKCTLSRSYNPAVTQRAGLASGRPLGLMAAWLEVADQFGSKADHHSALKEIQTSLEKRQEGRDMLRSLEGAELLLGYERPLEKDEPEEPIVIK